jgi:hypothetical protein
MVYPHIPTWATLRYWKWSLQQAGKSRKKVLAEV